jgi:hypothetical protein
LGGGFSALGSLAKNKDLGKRLYSRSGIVTPEQIKNAERKGQDPVETLMNEGVRGGVKKMRGQLDTMSEKAASDRSKTLRDIEKELPNEVVPVKELTSGLSSKIKEKNITPGAEATGYSRVLVDTAMQADPRTGGFILPELEKLGQRVKTEIKETKPPKTVGGLFTGDPVANQKLSAQGDLVSSIAEAQRNSAEKAFGSSGRAALDDAANRYGTAVESAGNLEKVAASQFGKARPFIDLGVGAGTVAGSVFAPGVAIPAATAYYLATNPAVQTYLGTGIHKLSSGSGASPAQAIEILRRLSQERANKE